MTKRIFRSICLVAITVFFASLILFMGVLYDYFSKVQQDQLKAQTALAAHGVNLQGKAYLEGLKNDDYHITWIDADGNVIYDSDKKEIGAEDYLQREEIATAFKEGYGESKDYSTWFTERYLYSAQKLSDGSVLRLGANQYTVPMLLVGTAQSISAILLIAVILSLLLASGISKKIVQPLNEIDLDEPTADKVYEELTPLLHRLRSQQNKLKKQDKALRRQRDEFDTVTGSMSEGLVLLNNEGVLITINRAAVGILGAQSIAVGENFFSLPNMASLEELFEESVSGKRSEKIVEISERKYQLDASPVLSGGKVSGVVVLIFDVTEKALAEQMRREFSANVSHELKTPLHSISGYAELLKNGMVKTEDVPQFSNCIYSEAHRLIDLVEDIIRLSNLDEESNKVQYEKVDISNLAKDIIKSLEPQAKKKDVNLSFEGADVVIDGIPQQLHGIIYNLCDNAIKYNKPKGSVSITVQNTQEGAVLTVKDTGIGIPKEHHERIFERFYRVDKSHSKEVGGTGLGLSIVKHAAKLHNATVKLESTVGIGTEISVTFPFF